MSTQIYADGILVESWDDTTRTHTDHRTGESRPYTDEENAAADDAAAADARMDDLEARVAALESVIMAAPVPDDPDSPDVPTWGDLVPAGWWYPDTLLRDADGTIYRNTSGTVLTTPPSGFPGGGHAWRGRLFVVVTGTQEPPPTDPDRPAGYVGAWSRDATYKAGDVVDRNGRYWRCLVPHGPEYQGTWGPPATGVWEDAGAAVARVTPAGLRTAAKRATI